MEDPVDRQPLAAKVAAAIEAELHEGHWAQGLPGYRSLATHFQVSWRTCQSALKILEQRGLVKSNGSGRSRTAISKVDLPVQDQQRLLFIYSSKITQDVEEQGFLDNLMLQWSKKGGHFRKKAVDYRRFQNPESTLAKMMEEHSSDVMVLREATFPWVRAAMANGKPAYFLGGDIDLSDYPKISGVAVSIRQMVTKAVKHLLGFGHTRILIPDEGRGESYQHAVIIGIRKGFEGNSEPPPTTLCCPSFPEIEPEAWQRYWADAFRKHRPTAVVIHKESSFLSLYSFCYKHQIQIPRDLSVICLSASKTLHWCEPRPVQVTFPDKKAVAHFRRWISNGFPVTGHQILPVEFVEGGSIAKI